MNTNNLHVIGRVISTVFRIKEIGVIVVMTRNACCHLLLVFEDCKLWYKYQKITGSFSDHFSSSLKGDCLKLEFLEFLIISPRWEVNPRSLYTHTMKFFAVLLCVGASQAFLVRREADAEAAPEAEADAGHYGYAAAPVAVTAPKCVSVPVKTCNPRQVVTPRKECHQEYDEIVDTTITEHCEEVVTTTCQQTSTHTKHSSAIVGHDSKV